MTDPRSDLKATEASIRDDARRLDDLEEAKASLDPTDPRADALSQQVERVAIDVRGKAAAERELAARLARLTPEQRRIVREGLRGWEAGQPNVGKSSLLNALSNSDLAIVSDEPGTTRDVREVSLDLGGRLVVLVDMAGLRTTESRAEAEGVRRAEAEIARAGDLGEQTLRRAVIYGSAMGSFAVERFSVGRLLEVGQRDIAERVREFHRLVSFEQEL